MMNCAGTALAITFSIASLTIALSEEPLGVSEKKSGDVEAESHPAVARPSLDEARRQAKVLHTAMHSTLQTVHHRYYQADKGLPIPAAILKDVFAELEEEQQIKLRWLVVEGQAMNSDHKPQGSFENEAVKVLKSGKREFEQAENGIYRRAASITLTNQCLKCHVPDRKSTENRTAGLIIAIPFEVK
jgi:hypothetical protein